MVQQRDYNHSLINVWLLQPIAQLQKSYLKDTTDFINFMEKTKIPKSTILVSTDVTSLYTRIYSVCQAYIFMKTNLLSLQNYLIDSSYKKTLSNLMERTTFKCTVLPWMQKWRSPLLVFAWQRLKRKSWAQERRCNLPLEHEQEERNKLHWTS